MDNLMQEIIEGSLDVTVSPTRVPFTDVSNKSKQGDKRSSNGTRSQTKMKRSDGPHWQSVIGLGSWRGLQCQVGSGSSKTPNDRGLFQ